jgi:hypothetical protein
MTRAARSAAAHRLSAGIAIERRAAWQGGPTRRRDQRERE